MPRWSEMENTRKINFGVCIRWPSTLLFFSFALINISLPLVDAARDRRYFLFIACLICRRLMNFSRCEKRSTLVNFLNTQSSTQIIDETWRLTLILTAPPRILGLQASCHFVFRKPYLPYFLPLPVDEKRATDDFTVYQLVRRYGNVGVLGQVTRPALANVYLARRQKLDVHVRQGFCQGGSPSSFVLVLVHFLVHI